MYDIIVLIVFLECQNFHPEWIDRPTEFCVVRASIAPPPQHTKSCTRRGKYKSNIKKFGTKNNIQSITKQIKADPLIHSKINILHFKTIG